MKKIKVTKRSYLWAVNIRDINNKNDNKIVSIEKKTKQVRIYYYKNKALEEIKKLNKKYPKDKFYIDKCWIGFLRVSIPFQVELNSKNSGESKS